MSDPLDPQVHDRFTTGAGTLMEITAIGENNVLAKVVSTGVEDNFPFTTVALWTSAEAAYVPENQRAWEYDNGTERGYATFRMASNTGRSIILRPDESWRPG
jgi:hypothetical protein